MKKLVLLIIGIFVGFNGFSQDHFACGLNKKLAKLYEENPQLEKDHEQLLLNGLKTSTEKGVKTTIFTIPIVFHIIHTYGAENISDAQVYDQVAILNRDYRLLNADTALVVNDFKQLYGDVGIEFKLASLDPFGRCTNGIEHIYSHEAFQGDDYSKLHQWNRANYLNVWVVAQMENGVAGYAYYPTAVEGSGFFRDGVIILNDYIGSIGTSNANSSRALTHEIGHYLGLSHPWGSTNEPGVQCGDDYMPDTPVTEGSNLVCNLNLNFCQPGTIENVQNYMDYSYCSVMFTLDQISAMRNILQGIAGKREYLIKPETAVLTGIDLTSPPLCPPTGDFYANKKFVCQGSTVTFHDVSSNAIVDSRQWIFEGGMPATSTAVTPTVTYDTPGYKTVTLIVTNSAGADTLVMNNFIHVSESYADFIGPKTLNLNDVYADWFRVDNPEENYSKFSLIDAHGFDNTKCFKLNNYKNTSASLQFSDDYFYYDRLGGNKDAIITPSFNLATTSSVNFSLKYAYATNSVSSTDIKDQLKIYVSKNCGETWTLRKTITGAELLSMGYAGYADYEPTSNTQWKTTSFAYSTSGADLLTRFKIEFTATDKASNLFIDDIMVDGILGLTTNLVDALDLSVYPNPTTNSQGISVHYTAQSEPVSFILRDIQGKELIATTRTEANQEVNLNLTESLQLKAACYFLEIRTGDFSTTKKIVVL